jgi:hypothetical protein
MKSGCSRVAFPLRVLILLMAALLFTVAPPGAAEMQEAGRVVGQDPVDEQHLPPFGKITTLGSGRLEIMNVNGESVTIKLTDKTEFRKDRQPAKRADFKVGDIILVRGEENPDHSWTAQVIAARSINGPGGRGGPRGELAQQAGTLGKDFVTGEIKSVDAPKLSVLRTDNVKQTIELNEDTSLRKGRESITMADIQPGDHVFARGGLENNVFVPKVVVIIGTEQWKRMQEWSGQGGQRRRGAGATPPPASGEAGSGGSDGQKPPEPQH